MKLGVVFPQTEIGADPSGVREYFQAAEQLGYSHVSVFDHVLGADLTNRPDWAGAYNSGDMFHEPMVLYGYAAAITQNLELVTSVLVLGQRQTSLVAKQAAEIDILTGGKFRLGIGVGWNQVEYEALGESFGNRGRREEEQMDVLRALWSNEVVTYHGRYHNITEAGLNPLPVQRPIPIWLGGRDERLLRRVAKMGDGWFPMVPASDEGRAVVDQLRGYAQEAGRDPSTIGIEARININQAGNNPEAWVEEASFWSEIGASHLSFNTMRGNLEGPAPHIDAIQRFKEAMPAGI
jgi:probable F420-dependent oxidoreductase